MKILIAFVLCTCVHALETNVYELITYRVIDGDSIEVTLDLGFNTYKQSSLRVMGINTPEVRTSNELEKEVGKLVAQFVLNQLQDKDLLCQYIKMDKYGGRFNGHLYIDGVSLSDILLDRGYAKPYDGTSTKPEFTDDELKAIRETF